MTRAKGVQAREKDLDSCEVVAQTKALDGDGLEVSSSEGSGKSEGPPLVLNVNHVEVELLDEIPVLPSRFGVIGGGDGAGGDEGSREEEVVELG